MTARALAHARRNRWVLSFADLALLLLGFFVVLQASNGRQHEVVSGVAQEFGAPVPARSDQLAARTLFQPGEALLTPAGEQALKRVAAHHKAEKTQVEIRSVGLDAATNRFDNWDLAAARLGAVARGLSVQGIPRERIVIRGLDQQSESKAGQQFIIKAR